MEATVIFDIITTTVLIIGICIGLIQLRQYHKARKREASMILLNSYQTKDFIVGIREILALDDELSKESVEKILDGKVEYIYFVMSSWESIGLLLFKKEVSIEMIDLAYSGPIILSWRKLKGYVIDLRQELDRDTLFEWFQWLAERIKEREDSHPPIPAHEAFKKWRQE